MSIAQQIVPSAPSFFSRFFAYPVTRMVLGIIAVMLPFSLTLMLAEILVPKPLRAVWPLLLTAAMCVLGYRLFVRFAEKRAVTELALTGAAREAGAGVALGAGLGLAVAGVLAATGAFTVTGASSDWAFLLKCLPEQIMVAFLEELIFRAVLFRIVEQRWGARTSLIVSFVLFAAAHLPNEHMSALGALITGVASLVLCACYMLTGRLWLSIGVHFGWNYLYDGLFAVPVSGHAPRGWLQVAMPGPEWLTGGSYGPEASVVTLVLWGAAAIVLLRRAFKR